MISDHPAVSFLKLLNSQLDKMEEQMVKEKSKKNPRGLRPMDLVLVSTGSGVRSEAIVEEIVEKSVLLRMKNQEAKWYDPNMITDVLGQATSETLAEFGYDIPEKVELKTGAYVVAVTIDGEKEYHMVEIDRVGTKYIYRRVGESITGTVTDNLREALMAFSDPDEPNEMTAEPGIYFVPCVNRTIEVIPFEGLSFFRYLDSSFLHKLPEEMAKDIVPIESDTLDINAIAIMPEEKPTLVTS